MKFGGRGSAAVHLKSRGYTALFSLMADCYDR